MIDPAQLLALLPLRPYQTIADIGCSLGDFTISLAKYLFDGKVYAVDSQQKTLDTLATRLQQIRLTNVEMVRSTKRNIGLDQESLDGALMPFILHNAEDKEALLEQVLRALQRSGWLAVLEWHKKETAEGPPLEERLARQEVEELTKAAGFRSVERRNMSTGEYMVLLRK